MSNTQNAAPADPTATTKRWQQISGKNKQATMAPVCPICKGSGKIAYINEADGFIPCCMCQDVEED